MCTQGRRRGVSVVQVALVVFLIDRMAMGSIGIPMEAMNVGRPSLYIHYEESRRRADASRTFTVFDGELSRLALLSGTAPRQEFTLNIAKEEFFRTQVPYGSLIYREATKNGLSPELIAAIVESESDFRPRLISNKEARGLMQIVPETARLMGCEDPFDPRANIAAGTRYLHYLVNRFGNERVALAALNVGEDTVERLGGAMPEDLETAAFVRRVEVRTRLYSARSTRFYSERRPQ